MSLSESLTFVSQSTPQWVEELSELTSKIASCKVELSELSDLTSQRLKPKNGSTESLRPRLNEAEDEPGTRQDGPQILGEGAKQQRAQMLRRKRKTASLSSEVLEPPKFRTRSMIIVRYDSQVQDGFTNFVRNIGTARNGLRKARMAETMAERLRQSEALEKGELPGGPGVLAGRLAFTRTTRSRGGETKTIFDEIDGHLENSQMLCEHAAHQSLRDGDCGQEISTVKSHLEEVSAMCAKEAVKQAEKEKERAEKERENREREEKERQEERDVEDEEAEEVEEQDGKLEASDTIEVAESSESEGKEAPDVPEVEMKEPDVQDKPLESKEQEPPEIKPSSPRPPEPDGT